MLHAMQGAAASAAGHNHCLKLPAIQATVGPARTSVQPWTSSSSSTYVAAQRRGQGRPAAAGNSESCRICGTTTSSGLEQHHTWGSEQQVPQADTTYTSTSSSSSSSSSSSTVHHNNGRSSRQSPGSSQQGSSSRHKAGSSSSNGKLVSQRSSSSKLQQAGPHAGQRTSGAAVMQQLKAATSWQQLQQEVEQHCDYLNWRHSCAMITHLAQLLPQQHWLQHTQQLDQPSIQQQRQQQQQQQEGPEQQLSMPSQQPLLSQDSQQQQQLQQQQQQLRNDPCLSTPEPVGQAQSQQDTVGTLTISIEHSSLQQHSSTDLQHFLQDTLMPLVDSHMQAYDARGLANCLWAVARLRAVAQPPSSWLQQFCSISEPLLQQFDAQQLSNTLWGLVQVQHTPPQAWMQRWYDAMLQACRSEDFSWQPQSVSSALWALAQLYSSGSSSSARRGQLGPGPSQDWLQQLLTVAMQRLAAAAAKDKGDSSTRGYPKPHSSGQAVSNMLWACVQLQVQPSHTFLLAVQSWLQQAAAGQQHSGHGGSGRLQQQISDQAVANSLWALGKLYQQQQQPLSELPPLQQQQQQQCLGSPGSIRKARGVLRSSGKLLWQLGTAKLAATSNQHLSNMLWGAGVLQLQLQPAAVDAVMQQLLVRAGSLTDQQVSNMLWGLSHLKQRSQQQQQQQQQQQILSVGAASHQQQQQEPQQQRHQQQLSADCIEQVLAAQEGRLQHFSSQAIGSTLLSVVRLQHIPADTTLHAWLQALEGRPLSNSVDLNAAVEACCALALLRQQQHQQAAEAYRSSSSRGLRSSSFGINADGAWLQAVCASSISRLGVFTPHQLCGVAWAMGVLQFRAPVPWLVAWQEAVNIKTDDGLSGALAARLLSVLQALPGIAAVGGIALQTTRVRLAEAAAASVTAAAAAGRVNPSDVAAAATCAASVRSRGSVQWVQQVLQVLLGVLPSCTTRQLATVLSAAAVVQVPLQPGLLSVALQEAQDKQRQRQQQQSGLSTVRLLVAVAKLTRQQQQQQQQDHSWTIPQQQPQPDQQSDQQQLLQWLQHSVPLLPLGNAPASYLSAMVWALAVLCYHPGLSWLDAWTQHSTAAFQLMEPQQLASCGWAMTVLRYRPSPQWLSAWSQAVAQHVAAGVLPAKSFSLLLYCSATLSCPVNTSWLRAVGVLAARQAGVWTLADVADGLWGLGQLGLRAVAEEEVLEVLLGRLLDVTAAPGQLQGLGPHKQLQVLQAAVLLGPGPDGMQQQQQQQWARQPWSLEVKHKRKRKLRWLNFRARSSAAFARQAAAAAAAAAAQQQDSGASGSAGREALAAVVGKAAVVAAKYVAVKTGRDPAAAAGEGVLKPGWLVYWCRCSLQQLHQWRPQQVAAALAAFAALDWQPPLVWQQQMLTHVLQQGDMSLQTAAAIQDALTALQSPLVKTWRQPITLQYIPQRSSPAAAAVGGTATQQLVQPAGGRAGQQGLQQQQLKGLQQQRAQLYTANAGATRREPSYPHHLRGNAMRRLCRKQRLMRLVSWWRQQQVMQQQYALQRQQQLEDQWRAAGVPTGADSYGSYDSSSSSSTYTSPFSSVSAAASPRSSVDGAGELLQAGRVTSSPLSTAASPTSRSLDGSSWGRQLVRPPARPTVAPLPPPPPAAAAAAATAGEAASSGAGSADNVEAVASSIAAAAAELSATPGPAAAQQAHHTSSSPAFGNGTGSWSGTVPTNSNSSSDVVSTTSSSSSSSSGGVSPRPAAAAAVSGAAPAVSAAGGGVQVMRSEAATLPVTGWESWATAGVAGPNSWAK